MSLDSAAVNAYRDGTPVQLAFPAMSADQREMLISGTHPACWTAMFAEDES